MLQRRVSPAKRYLQRTLQVVALVGTIVIGVIALALIVSQTPWFRDWLRRFVIRESKQYVNGDLAIGSLGGNLFYGVQLGDVSIDVDGEHVVTLKRLEIKYSIAELISKGMTVRQIRLEQPFLLVRHDASGWNLAKLVKRQEQEADRQGPGKPLSLPDIEIVNGSAVIDDRAPSDAYRLPKRVDALNVKAGYEYAPVHYSLTLNSLSFAGRTPDLTLQQLSGRVGTRDDNLNVDKLTLRTPQSDVTVDGVIRNYLANPSLQLTVSAPKLSLPEFGGVLPVVQGYDLHPTLDLKAAGTQDALQLTLNEKSEAGGINGTVTADVKAPDYAVRGDVDVQDLNLAPLLKDPAQKSDITGRAQVDLHVASAPASAPAVDRMRGHLVFSGSRVAVAGYRATDVRASADLAGRRIGLDARANAYGGSATAKGFIVTPAAAGQPLQFDLAGSASHVNLAGLPRTINAPRMTTNLNATAYHVKGSAGPQTSVEGDATMGQSTIAGGTILDGTTTQFSMASTKSGLQSLTYASRGGVRNLNLQKVGQAFQIAALAKPEYDSTINAAFDVKGSGVNVNAMRLDATGTATDSQVFGGNIPRLAFEAHLNDGAVQGRANGEVQGFDPSRISGNPQYKGTVNGTVNASFGIANISAPITPEAITADGQITLANSDVAGVKIDTADIQGNYANRRGEVRQATVKGPDIALQASGPISLDTSGQSNLKYHVEATNLTNLGKLFNQPLGGSVISDGTITGNASVLTANGTVTGSDLAYQQDKALSLKSTFTATVPDLQVAHAKIQAQTSSTFVQIGSIQLNVLNATTTYADQKLDFQTHLAQAASNDKLPASGEKGGRVRELDATGSVVFHPDHQEIHLPSLALRTQGVEWKTAAGSQAAIQYGGDRVQVTDLRLVNGNQTLGVDGQFSTGNTPQLGGITVQAKNVDIAQLEQLMLQDRGFTGTLTANATLTGDAKAPDVKGHVEIANGGFRQFKYQSLTADGSYAADRVTVDAKLVQSPGAELTAKGTIPTTAFSAPPPGTPEHVQPAAGQGIDLRVQSSRIDLGIVQGFTDQVRNVTGTLQADVRVTGSGYDPHLNGYVDIQNGGFAVLEAGTSFSGMTTRIELEPDRIRVPRFQILDKHGSPLTIQGDLAVHERQGGAVNISMKSDDFKLLDNELGKVSVDSDLRLTGEVRRPRVEGDLKFESARLELDKLLLQFTSPYSTEALPDVVSAEQTTTSDKGADEATRDALAKGREIRNETAPKQNAAAPTAPAPEAGPASALALNVHVVAPDDFVVRGTDLRPSPTSSNIGNVNLTVGADLHVLKDPGGPITLRGTANTVRGFYEFQGRRFTVQRDGTAEFHGSTQINPDIDVTAERLIPNTGVTARIHITGTPKSPQLALSSTPPLDEADILSLIIFNRNVNELGTGERASLAETAGGIASGFVASSLGKSIGKALDVDLFEITTSDAETGETAGGVTLGKQVSDKAFVKFQQQFGQRSFTEFMMEYQLAKFLRLDTMVAPETSGAANRLTQRRVEHAGVDLIFFFSY